MRSKNSLLNIISIILMQVISLALGFMARKLFVDNLPFSLLGVSQLFNDFFYAIGLVDIGFASILIYNLYKPINENDEEKVKWFVSAFKKIYITIASIIGIISLAAMPFIFSLFKINYDNKILIYFIYVIQLFTVISKYFFIHKTNIIVVSQQKWKINFITIGLSLIWFIFKAISMIVFKSYILYLIIILLDVTVINIINIYITNKKYPYLKKLPKVKYKEIINSGILAQSKNFIYHIFYNFVYYSTDSFIISNKIGTTPLAFIGNYTMLIRIFDEFISSIISSLRDSLANFLHIEKDVKGLFEVYKMTNILNYFMSSVAIIGLYSMIDKWIPLWLGSKFIIDRSITILLIVNLGIDLIFRPLENIYSIKGYVFKEKLPIFISAITNLVISLLLVDTYGIAGVFFGTFIGKLVFWYGKIYYVTNDVFINEKKETIFNLISLFILLILQTYFINYIVDALYPIISDIFTFILRGIVVIILVFISNIIVFYKSIYFKKLVIMFFTTLKNLKKGVSNG